MESAASEHALISRETEAAAAEVKSGTERSEGEHGDYSRRPEGRENGD